LIPVVQATDGNLHIDAGVGKDTYLNYYSGANVYFGNGATGGIFARIANDGSFRSPIFYDYNDTSYYVDPNSSSRLVNLGLGGVTPDVRLSVSGDAHISAYLYMGGTAGSSGSWSSRLLSSGGSTTLNTSIFEVNRVGYGGGGSFNMDTGGNSFASSSFRAPIFYDSNDTTYYTDPNSTSSMFGVAIRGDLSSTGIGNQIFFWGGSPSTTSAIGFKASGGNFSNPTGNGDGYNTYLTMDSDGRGWVFRRGVGGSDFSAAFTSGWILNNGIWQANSSMRAPIFYDSNNTGYYLDPASTSNLNQVNLQGILRRNTSAAGYLEGNYPSSTDGNSSACIYTIGGSYQPGTTSLGNMYGCGYTVGTGTASPGLGMSGWGFYVASGGTSRVFLDSDSGVVISSGSTRSPIFYDRDNTGYYLDPTGTSNLNVLQMAGTIFTSTPGYSSALSGIGFAGSIRSGETNVGGSGGVYIPYIAQTSLSSSGYRQHTVFGSYRGQVWGSAFIAVGGNDSYPTVAFFFDYGGSFTAPGNVTANSDERLKTNWRDMPENFVSRLAQVKVGIYDRTDLATKPTQVGVGAQSLQTLLPQAINKADDEMGTLSVNYGGAALASAIELAKYVTALEQRISQLEARI